MATIQDAIKRLIYQFSSVGADQLVADQNKVADANANIAATSQTASTASLSLEKSFDSLERRYVTTVRAQQDFEAVQNKVNAAVAQNPALQERANVVLDAAKAKLEAVSGSTDLLSKITDKARESMVGFALEGGAVGGILGSFGPWGVAAAAGIGLVSAAFDYLNEHASKFGEASIGIKNFGQVSGITTTQVRGLQEAAEKAGESGDSIATSFERFTVNLESARDGTGSLFDSIQKINPALAVQIASTKSSAEAWDILAKATNSTTDATTRAALARAAFGKGGVADVPVLIATDNAGGLAAYSEEVQKATGITDQLTLHTAQLAVQIAATKKQTENIYASLYSDEVLSRQAKFAKAQLDIAQTIASYVKTAGGFKFSDLLPSESQPGLTTLEVNAAAQGSSAPAAPGGSVSAGESAADSSAKIKEQADATQQLTIATTALGAAQANADKAQQSYNEQSASLTATTKSLTDSRKNAGDALLLLSNLEKQQIAALSGAATGDEIRKQRVDALTAALDKGTISQDTYNRAIHGDTGNQLAALSDQLSVVQALAGSEKLAAQYASDYNAQLRAGKEPADALQLAAAKLAITSASAVTAASQQTQSLKDRNDLAAAGNGLGQVEALRAQQSLAGQQAYNQVMKDTGAEQVAQLAGQNAFNDVLNKTGDEQKAIAAGNKAYTNDILNGEAAQAATNKQYEVTRGYQQDIDRLQKQAAATALEWQQNMLGVGSATVQAASAAQSAADAFQRAANSALEMAAGVQAASNGDFGAGSAYGAAGGYASGGAVTKGTQYTSSGIASYGTSPSSDLTINAALAAFRNNPTTADSIASKALASGGFTSALQALQNITPGTTPSFNFGGVTATGTTISSSDITSSIDKLISTLQNQSSDKSALSNLLSFEKSQPLTIASAQAIADLNQALGNLTTSTSTLNSTMQDALSPYYTQDPRTSHIGFRSQGMATGGELTVPGGYSANDNMLAQIPVASGEIVSVRRPGQDLGSGGTTQINLGGVHVTVAGNASKEDANAIGRTVFQAMQSAAKRIQAASL